MTTNQSGESEKLTYKERRFLVTWLFWVHMAMAFVSGGFIFWAFQEIFK